MSVLKVGDTLRAALVAAIGAIPLLVFAIYLETVLETEQERANYGQFRRAAENFALVVEQKLRSELGALEGLGSSSALDSGDLAGFQGEMERLQARHPDWFTVVLADGERQLANLRFKPGEGLPTLNDPTTQQKIIASGRPAVGTLVAGRVGIGVPVFRDGSPRYVLAAIVSPELFVLSLHQFSMAADRVATLADSAGNIIGRSDAASSFTGQPLSSEFQDFPAHEPNQVFEATTPDGEQSVAVMIPVGNFGWSVLLQAPKASFTESFLPLRTAVWSGAAIAIALTLVLLVIARRAEGARRQSQELRQANELLRISETQYARLANATIEGVVIHEQDRIIDANEAFCRMFGYTADEAVRKAPVDLVSPEVRPEFEEHIRSADERPYETVGLRKDGTTFPIEIAARNIDYAGHHVRVKVIRDLTAEKQAETALQESRQRLRDTQSELLHVSRLTEMGQMVAALAHEVNQPIAAVMNYVNASRGLLNAEKVDGKTVEDLRRILGRADQQAILAAEIVRRLRNFISREDSERRIESAPEVFTEAIDLALAGTRHEDVNIERSIETEARILVDKVQIQQVLVNLVRNAIEAMEDSPQRELAIVARNEAGSVKVQVVDTGSGLAPEIVDRLFQPFATTKSKGMGIGLSVSRSIIEAHDGAMNAEPRPGGGIIFWFTLPVFRFEGEASDAAAE